MVIVFKSFLSCVCVWRDIHVILAVIISLMSFELWCRRRLLRVPIFIGRIDAEAEAPILWPPDAKS